MNVKKVSFVCAGFINLTCHLMTRNKPMNAEEKALNAKFIFYLWRKVYEIVIQKTTM